MNHPVAPPAPTRAANITRQFDDARPQPHDPTAMLDWSDLAEAVARGGTFWLTTIDTDGRPHTRPVFAVVADGHLVTASSTTAAKTTHLRSERPASIATSSGGLDIVWIGRPTIVDTDDELEAIAAAYRHTYGWDAHADPTSHALTAPYGAPTAGPPPYEAYRIAPHTVHAIATSEPFTGQSTRWEFP